MADMLEKIRKCRRCVDAGFDAVRPPPIFSGDLDASLLIIGQAPGLIAHEHKSPFVRAESGCFPGCNSLGRKSPGLETTLLSFSATSAILVSDRTEMAIVGPVLSSWRSVPPTWPACSP
jgi:hypothetical protein